MDNFILEGRRIQNNTIEQISEEYQDLLRTYRRKLFSQIIDIVNYEIRGIPEHRMEEWIDDYLVSEIKSQGNRQINKLDIPLNTNFEELIRNISNKPDFDYSFEQYLENLKK